MSHVYALFHKNIMTYVVIFSYFFLEQLNYEKKSVVTRLISHTTTKATSVNTRQKSIFLQF